MGEYTSWTLSAGDVVVEVTATLDGSGNVTFSYELISGVADLNGFFIDIGNDGGDISNLGGGNNMKGSDSDGDKLDGFDFAEKIGTVGGNDADTTSGTLTYSLAELGISSLAELASAEIGIRATSVGEDREGSLKLAGTGTYHPDTPPDDDFFPEWPQDISHITLVFDQDEGDVKPNGGGDGYYTVKIDEWPGDASADLDDSIDDIIAWLVENDEFVFDDANLVGVVIKGGTEAQGGGSDFFSYGDYDTNGTDPDPLPAGLGFDLTGANGNENPANAIDTTYNYDAIFV